MSRFQILRLISLGVITTLVANVVTFLTLSSIAPRREEGIRNVITWDWQHYFLFAYAIPLVVVFIVAFAWTRRWQMSVLLVLVGVLTEILWFQYSHAHLLYRDYLGKF